MEPGYNRMPDPGSLSLRLSPAETGGTMIVMTYKDGLIVAADTRSVRRNEDQEIVYESDDNLKITKINSYMVLTHFSLDWIAKHLVEKYSVAEQGHVGPSHIAEEAYEFMKQMRNINTRTLLLAYFDNKEEKHEIFKVTQSGVVSKSDCLFECSGSGNEHAKPILSEHFCHNMELDYAVGLASYAIYSASLKDEATGERALVWKITAEGVSKVCCKTRKELPSKG